MLFSYMMIGGDDSILFKVWFITQLVKMHVSPIPVIVEIYVTAPKADLYPAIVMITGQTSVRMQR